MNKAVEWFEKRITAEKQICSLPTCDEEVKEAKERHISYMQEAISAIKFREAHEEHVLSPEEQVSKLEDLCQVLFEGEETDAGRKVTIERIKKLVGYTRWLELEF